MQQCVSAADVLSMTVSAIKELSRTAEGRRELLRAGVPICSIGSHLLESLPSPTLPGCPEMPSCRVDTPLLLYHSHFCCCRAPPELLSRAIFSQKRQCRQNKSWTGSKSEARANRGYTGLDNIFCCSTWCYQWANRFGTLRYQGCCCSTADTVVGNTVEPAAVVVAMPYAGQTQ